MVRYYNTEDLSEAKVLMISEVCENTYYNAEEVIDIVAHIIIHGDFPKSYKPEEELAKTDYELIGEQFGWVIADMFAETEMLGCKTPQQENLACMCNEYLDSLEDEDDRCFYTMEITMPLDKLESLEVTLRCQR